MDDYQRPDPQAGPDQVSGSGTDGILPSGGMAMCIHTPGCPDSNATDCCSAHVVSDHLDDQGWCRLCNGLIVFDDGHYLSPDGHDHAVPLSA